MKFSRYIRPTRSRFFSVCVVVLALGLGGCLARDVPDDVLQKFRKEHPNTEIVNARAQRLASPQGLLGWSVFVKFVYRSPSSANEESVIWYATKNFDGSWTVEGRNERKDQLGMFFD